MDSYAIYHEVGIKAAPEEVYRALTETGRLAGWWTSDTRGDGSTVGGVLQFWFGDHCKEFEVVGLQPGKLVRWRTLNGNDASDEWNGTEITFGLSTDDHQCWVRFSHAGWRRPDGFLPHCTTKWGVFMLSLKDLLEKGKGQPFPDDVEVNHGW